MIDQLPIINMIMFLVLALAIPFLRKVSFRLTLILGFVVLGLVTVSSVFILTDVMASGPILYRLGGHERLIGIELEVDLIAALISLFILGLALVIYIYSTGDATEGIEEREYARYYILFFILMFSLFGMVYANDLFNNYVFMEIMSITTCSIISIKRKKDTYTSAFRYVMLNEIGSLSFLFGVALLYMATGFTNITLLQQALSTLWPAYSANVIIALGFMLVGLGIKAAIFPFHIWLPDAHASAPSTSSAILSGIVIKIYLFVMIKVLFKVFGLRILDDLNISAALIAIGSLGMIFGSLFAIAQKDIKRLLGYSSIAQVGYIVLGIGLFSELGLAASVFHIFSHGMMKSALFLSVGIVVFQTKRRKIADFAGLGQQLPLSMGVFGIAALAMIGLPLTSGFISKLTLGVAALDHNQGYLIVIVILSSLLGVIYYLPILVSAFLKRIPEDAARPHLEKVPRPMIAAIVILALAIIVFGVFPNWILDIIEQAVATLGLPA